MMFKRYFKDKFLSVSLFVVSLVVLYLLFFSFKVRVEVIISVYFVLISCFLIVFLYDFFRKRKFYNKFLKELNLLDKKYLILELINKPNFLDGEILYNSLYEVNKNMNEKIKEYELSLNDFKEFIELWVHEVKLPISALNLMLHNKKSSRKLITEVEKLDKEVERVLYYIRSENTNEDYLISEVSLDSVISNVALKNKNMLLESNISFKFKKTKLKVLTDAKWLEFIINQIISNSIKYKKENDSEIKIEVTDNEKEIDLSIYDNGMGIPKSDLCKVFNKTFTGRKGRKIGSSTGMGLYIVKKLCDKLSHKIEIESVSGEFTKVSIIFRKNDYYKVLK